MKYLYTPKRIMAVAFMLIGLVASAQLVDRATFDRYLSEAEALSNNRVSLRAKAAAAETRTDLSTNPLSIDEIVVQPGENVTVPVYFDTSVMAPYRDECCPRVVYFDLVLPEGISVVSTMRGSELQFEDAGTVYADISVTGNYVEASHTLRVLGYGLVNADMMHAYPTGKFEYALITLKADASLTPGTTLDMSMSAVKFVMADEPSAFYYNTTDIFNINIIRNAASIALDKTEATMTVGETLQLNATVLPADVTNGDVTWSTSDATIATVDENGLVTALAVGNVTITATTADGTELTATCAITVNPIVATSITLDKTEATMLIGETLQLTATVLPENVANGDVTWSTSDATIATVENGLVTALAVGNVTITATTADGTELTATCAITVNPIVATSIALDKTEAAMLIGETLQLTATVLPENVTNGDVTWSTSDEAIATVENGLVTALAVGNVTITATTADGTELTATCAITVNPIVATSIALDKTEATMLIGETLQLTATVLPENVTNGDVTWSTSDEAIATVENGLVTALAVGNVTITATTADGTELTATCAITVNPIVATSIALDKTEATMLIGETLQLTATVLPENVTNGDVTWSTSDEAIATVENGLVTAVAPGNVTITATTADGTELTATCAITVNPILAESIALDKTEATMNIGETLQLTATVLPENVTSDDLAWTSSDEAIATVENGLVTAVAPGNVTITATTTDGSELSATCAITVNPILATSIELNETSAFMYKGQTLQLEATVLPENVTNGDVTWSTSDETIATVDENGLVTAVKGGDAVITATTADGSNLTATCNIRVYKRGDVNNDGEVNGADLNILINIILGKDSADNYDGRANVHEDDEINGSDINDEINILLGKDE